MISQKHNFSLEEIFKINQSLILTGKILIKFIENPFKRQKILIYQM